MMYVTYKQIRSLPNSKLTTVRSHARTLRNQGESSFREHFKIGKVRRLADCVGTLFEFSRNSRDKRLRVMCLMLQQRFMASRKQLYIEFVINLSIFISSIAIRSAYTEFRIVFTRCRRHSRLLCRFHGIFRDGETNSIVLHFALKLK